MGKITKKAIRLGNEYNNEKTWEEFARNHPEVNVFFYKENVIDVDPFSNKIKNFTIHRVNGFVESIIYEYDGKLVEFPK